MNYMNPLLNQLNNQTTRGLSSNNQQLNQIKSMMNMVRGARNPNAMLNQLMMNNPRYNDVINYIQQNGGDPKQAFYQKAQEMGINPNDVLNMLK